MNPKLNTIPFLILVGGLGTRLASVSTNKPKCLMEINGRPFLFYLLDQIQRAKGKNVILLTGHLHQKIEEAVLLYSKNCNNELNISFSHEIETLGTGGSLLKALDLVEDLFFLMNGDSFLNINLESLTDFCPSIAVVQMENCAGYGRVDFDLNNFKINHFAEKSSENYNGHINSGIYFFHKKYFKECIKRPCSLEIDLFPLLVRKYTIKAQIYSSYFIDIGTPERLLTTKKEFANNVL
jgi:D-glycero-alpha-D-manno-heptose 1-phosphate guanylyltransferase